MDFEKPDLIKDKSYQFVLRIISLYRQMQDQNEYVLSKQLLRAGTGIGANVEEASAAHRAEKTLQPKWLFHPRKLGRPIIGSGSFGIASYV